jgi:hypothetical protein
MLALGNSFYLYHEVLEVFLYADSFASQQLLVDDLDDEVVAAVVRVPTLGLEDLVVLRRDSAEVLGVDEADTLTVDGILEAELRNNVLMVDDGGAIFLQNGLKARLIFQ